LGRGARAADGRACGIASATPDWIANGDTGHVTHDHCHDGREDMRLAKELGLRTRAWYLVPHMPHPIALPPRFAMLEAAEPTNPDASA
jgi:hypothetical protein